MTHILYLNIINNTWIDCLKPNEICLKGWPIYGYYVEITLSLIVNKEISITKYYKCVLRQMSNSVAGLLIWNL
jgi:hypothetical protein